MIAQEHFQGRNFSLLRTSGELAWGLRFTGTTFTIFIDTGIPDDLEDSDGDGIPNHLDSDDDNDGIPDEQDENDKYKDSDGDGIPDHFDDDVNGDGIADDEKHKFELVLIT